MGEKSKFTDALLAKKLRETAGIEGKKKAVIALADLLEALEVLEEEGRIYAVTVTSANDLLIEKADHPKDLPLEQKQRRQRHEKSQALFTNGDLNQRGKKNCNPAKKPKHP